MKFASNWKSELAASRGRYRREHRDNDTLRQFCADMDQYLAAPTSDKKALLVKTLGLLKKRGNPDWPTPAFALLHWVDDQLTRKARVVAGRTVVFVPFEGDYAAEQLKSTVGEPFPYRRDNKVEMAEPGADDYVDGWPVDREDVICLTSANRATKLGGLRDPDDVLYIRGHCRTGGQMLSSRVPARKEVDVDDLVNLLRGSLDTSFQGAIKIYACQSGSGTADKPSFTQCFADRMFAVGYRSCRFFGYPNEVSTGRYRRDEGGTSQKMDIETSQRASATRVQVWKTISDAEARVLAKMLDKKKLGVK